VRLLTCSNSGPRLTEDSDQAIGAPQSPGGLVPILSALLDEVGGHWIFTGPTGSGAQPGRRASTSRGHVSWHGLGIPEHLLEQQHGPISIGTLLWLFHYLHDTSMAPSFDDRTRSSWDAYVAVNGEFAAALATVYDNSPDEVVLINDFHLMMVPARFSELVGDRSSKLIYFHHVPWCEPDYFGLLPDQMRNHILASLLTCDVVGFHCERWGNAFLACCDRYLDSATVVGNVVDYRDHRTTITAAPGPIDALALSELNDHPSTVHWRELLLDQAGGRQVITRVDRLDLWKNIVRGIHAYELLLRRDPRIGTDTWFCAIVAPTRLQTDRHRRYQALCEETARQVNDRFANGQREVVSLLYPDEIGTDRSRAVAALSIGVATLVNPTFDGLNMVAKESVVVNPAAHLLLSINAGAYSQLQQLATPIQPFDLTSTANALEDALKNPKDEHSVHRAALRDETAMAWLNLLLHGAGQSD
jgi:trehalose 6-phosphate synthase